MHLKQKSRTRRLCGHSFLFFRRRRKVWLQTRCINTTFFLFKQNCIFNKTHENTSLRVFYEGSLCTKGALRCSRWYFTFDGAECKNPATIEGIIYSRSTTSLTPRPCHIEGYCNRLRKGQIRVEFRIGKCALSYFSNLGEGTTGLSSQSRIVIEEVPPPQA